MIFSVIFNGSTVNRLLALSALILAFPPVFTKHAHHEGLLMSLSLALFYFIRGILSLSDPISQQSTVRPSQFFRFAEIPAIALSVYFGLKWLPEWLAKPYESVLLYTSPFFVLVEGVSSMVIILECGERCSAALNESASIVKAAVASVCFAVFGISFLVIKDIYNSSLLGISSARY